MKKPHRHSDNLLVRNWYAWFVRIMGSNHIIIAIRFFSSTLFITQVIHLGDEYTDTDKYFKMVFWSCLCLICHITSSSHLIFQELQLLLQTQRHKDRHGRGADEGRRNSAWEKEGKEQQCRRKGAAGEEIKRQTHVEREGLGISQMILANWEGSGTDEVMTGDSASLRSPAGQGNTKLPPLSRLERHIVCHWKDQFPRLTTNLVLLFRTFKVEAGVDPLHLREGWRSTTGNQNSQRFHYLLCEEFLDYY